jgi:hypothetical protein
MSNLVDFLLPPSDGVLPTSVELGQPIALQLDPAIRRVVATTTATSDLPGASSTSVELEVIGGRVTIPGPRFVGVLDLRIVDDGTGEGGAQLGQTAANLFNPGESRITPGDPARIADLGSAGPVTGAESNAARNEWWWPLALAAFLLLLAEWLLFHRPTRRAIGRLLRRRASGPTPSVRRPTRAGS